jgi:hypothetical protein
MVSNNGRIHSVDTRCPLHSARVAATPWRHHARRVRAGGAVYGTSVLGDHACVEAERLGPVDGAADPRSPGLPAFYVTPNLIWRRPKIPASCRMLGLRSLHSQRGRNRGSVGGLFRPISMSGVWSHHLCVTARLGEWETHRERR